MTFVLGFALVAFGRRIGAAQFLIASQLLSPPPPRVLLPTLPAVYVATCYDLGQCHGDQ